MRDKLTRLLCAALRQNLEGAKRPPPEAGRLLWSAFAALSQQRTYSWPGPNAISFQEIEVYCRLMNLPLSPRHISALIAMDRVWIDHANQQSGEDQKGGVSVKVSKQPLTGEIFDAIFG